MSRNTQWLMRALAVLAASFAACSSAMADAGHDHARSESSFSSGGGNSSARGSSPGHTGGGAFREGGRSHGGSHGGWSGARSFSSPRASGSFSTGRNLGMGGNFSSSDALRTAPAPGSSGFSGAQHGSPAVANPYGVRIPGATRPRYAPGAHPRPGFSTTQPDFGVQPRYTTRPGFAPSPGFRTRPDFHGGPAFRHGPGFSHRPHWNGGYWNGRFWPRAYYRPNFVWFWPVLPGVYTTFWFGGIPYYYVDDVYYTWSPERYGYVVTDPPPAAESTTPEDSAAGSGAAGSASVYVYPRNGQSEEQTSNDRYECHQWAASQTGFDPTTANGDTASAGSAADYRRALIACLDARGYSAN